MSLPEDFDHDTPDEPSCNTQLDIGCNSQLAMGALPCDAYHHYYHYQSSAQYTWLARTLFALGEHKEAMGTLEKALFQDHFNAEALSMKAQNGTDGIESAYDKHPKFDAEFLASIGKFSETATKLHDGAVLLMQEKHYAQGTLLLQTASKLAPDHSNSQFALGRCAFLQGDYAVARDYFGEAVRLSHLAHDAYHRAASGDHVKRGKEFLVQSEADLAINEFNKALDLHRGNEEAVRERARAREDRE